LFTSDAAESLTICHPAAHPVTDCSLGVPFIDPSLGFHQALWLLHAQRRYFDHSVDVVFVDKDDVYLKSLIDYNHFLPT
jgi:hypothetical protein